MDYLEGDLYEQDEVLEVEEQEEQETFTNDKWIEAGFIKHSIYLQLQNLDVPYSHIYISDTFNDLFLYPAIVIETPKGDLIAQSDDYGKRINLYFSNYGVQEYPSKNLVPLLDHVGYVVDALINTKTL